MVSISAPSWRSGFATRSIGRCDSDSSPVSVASTPAPARIPRSRRIVVPELPQSSRPTGSRSPPSPRPRMMASSSSMSGSRSGSGALLAGRSGGRNVGRPSSGNSWERGFGPQGVPSPRSSGTPSCARHLAVERTSSPPERPATRLSPSASAANSSARWEMLLSPGTRTPSARTGFRSGETRALTRAPPGASRGPSRRRSSPPRASASRTRRGSATACRRSGRGPDRDALR